jgi:hypothetical protein
MLKEDFLDAKNKINQIAIDISSIKQGLNGVPGGQSGLYTNFERMKKKQDIFERYIYMFHGAIVIIGIIFSIYKGY